MEASKRRYRATGLPDVMRRQGRRNDWLAAVAGVSEATITRLLRGERLADEIVATKIADVFELPIFLLFELSDESQASSLAEALAS